jgi:hypothetical protein
MHAARRRPNKVRVPEEARPELPRHRYLSTGPLRQRTADAAAGVTAPSSLSIGSEVEFNPLQHHLRRAGCGMVDGSRSAKLPPQSSASLAQHDGSNGATPVIFGGAKLADSLTSFAGALPATAPSVSRDGSRSPIGHCAAPGSVELSEPLRRSIRGCQRRWIDPFSPLGPWRRPRPRGKRLLQGRRRSLALYL